MGRGQAGGRRDGGWENDDEDDSGWGGGGMTTTTPLHNTCTSNTEFKPKLQKQTSKYHRGSAGQTENEDVVGSRGARSRRGMTMTVAVNN